MKKYFMIAALLMACAINIKAEDAWGDLYIPDVVVAEGEKTATLQLCLKNNAVGANGFEATLQLPTGFTLSKNAARGDRLKERVDPEDEESDYIFSFSQKAKENGRYVQAFTTNEDPSTSKLFIIPGTDGEVVKFTVAIPDGASGEYEIKLIDTEVANGSKVISTYTSVTSKLTVGATGITEVNADGMQADGKYLKAGHVIIKKGNRIFNAVGGIVK